MSTRPCPCPQCGRITLSAEVEADLANLARIDPEGAQALGELAREGLIFGYLHDDDGNIHWRKTKFSD
jgi:hypothetical protein